jgi:hypothetical protein
MSTGLAASLTASSYFLAQAFLFPLTLIWWGHFEGQHKIIGGHGAAPLIAT